ncbi:hypothetical protein ABVA33_05020 [Streptococcus dysgalactiae subsp. equisimilis]|uniref:Laminin-binding surface protein n=1 Tax=Streptococcus dysgalactiae subsp. equisimilis TaxID=119602 RepID=A0AAE9QTA5_STREQ|nr:hypothetical protein [Streptococcus dysgalactiae]OBY97168.1 hypothetical protein BBG01_04375 [Streptococcus dysgalactiae subsp. equisimilis]OCX01461.1 hypothetical protein BBG10_06665 [Streptococcus dysgalactiae subsp. equisimilis]VTT14667.1 laminin-binding surface protein [Streptococcus dysgalactiae subsp. equisimilis]VTT16292.1 laminin-binding surface protein [Streptococcus dysgalactiae]
MRKNIVTIVTIVTIVKWLCLSFLFVGLSGCRSVDKPLAKGLHIKTSFYPIYALTKEISGDLQPD